MAPPEQAGPPESARPARRLGAPLPLSAEVVLAHWAELPTFSGETLPRLYRMAGWRAGLWVRRASWRHAVAHIRTVNGQTRGKLTEAECRPVARFHEGPIFSADLYDLRSGILEQEDVTLGGWWTWEWSWIGVPPDLHALGQRRAHDLALPARKRRRHEQRHQEQLAALLDPERPVRIMHGTYPHRAELRRLGCCLDGRGWLVPVGALDAVLALLASPVAEAEVRAQLAARGL